MIEIQPITVINKKCQQQAAYLAKYSVDAIFFIKRVAIGFTVGFAIFCLIWTWRIAWEGRPDVQ